MAAAVALTGSVVVVSHDGEAPQQVTLRTDQPSPSSAPEPTPSVVPSAVATPSHVPVAVPTALPPASLPPVPVPLPSLPDLPDVEVCPGLDLVRPWPGSTKRIPVDRGSDDVLQIGSAQGRVWLESHQRVSPYRTSLVGISVAGGSPTVINAGGIVHDWQLEGTSLVGSDPTGPLYRYGTDGGGRAERFATTPDGKVTYLWDIAAAKGHVFGVGSSDRKTPYLFSFALPGLTQEWAVPFDHVDGITSGSALQIGTDGDDVYAVTSFGNGLEPTDDRVWRFSSAGKQLGWADVARAGAVNWAPMIAVTDEGPVIVASGSSDGRTTSVVRLDADSLHVTRSWTERGRVEQLEVVNGDVWLTSLGACGDNAFVLTRRDPDGLTVLSRQLLPGVDYIVSALGSTAWTLLVNDASEAVALESFPLA
jgi:hypothetical protein